MATILSVSVPSDVRASLDAEAKRQRRSRSFVVAEAVREYVASREREAFARGRDQTLREALALSPAACAASPVISIAEHKTLEGRRHAGQRFEQHIHPFAPHDLPGIDNEVAVAERTA